MPPSKYIDTITKPNSWGGAIELTILAAHYNTEIASIDVETGRIDRYTPPSHDSEAVPVSKRTRCILIYSGIHYDAVSLAPSADAPEEWHQTIFEIVRTYTMSRTLILIIFNFLFVPVYNFFFCLQRSTDDSSDPVLIAAEKLAGILRSKKAFTNTSTFDLRCEVSLVSFLISPFSFTVCRISIAFSNVERVSKARKKRERMLSRRVMFVLESINQTQCRGKSLPWMKFATLLIRSNVFQEVTITRKVRIAERFGAAWAQTTHRF